MTMSERTRRAVVSIAWGLYTDGTQRSRATWLERLLNALWRRPVPVPVKAHGRLS